MHSITYGRSAVSYAAAQVLTLDNTKTQELYNEMAAKDGK